MKKAHTPIPGVALFALLAACSPQHAEEADATDEAALSAERAPIVTAPTDAPAGDYTLDKAHASLLFRVNHLGFSNYTARFLRFDAALQFDPADPEASSVHVTIDPRSIETDYPDPDVVDFNVQLQGEPWLHTTKFPDMAFSSLDVELTGPKTMRIHGELVLRGVTRPLALDAIFNGGYARHALEPRARIGFSASGGFKRSDFGMTAGVPAPGSLIGVSDDVEVLIEAEFNGPAWVDPSPVKPGPQSVSLL